MDMKTHPNFLRLDIALSLHDIQTTTIQSHSLKCKLLIH